MIFKKIGRLFIQHAHNFRIFRITNDLFEWSRRGTEKGKIGKRNGEKKVEEEMGEIGEKGAQTRDGPRKTG